MTTRRRYTAKQRAEAAGIAIVEGVTRAGEQTGIPKTTIQRWLAKPECVQMRTTAREEFLADIYVGMQIGSDALAQGLADPEVPLNHKAAAWSALVDRYALLSGEATSRSETRQLDTLSDAAVALLDAAFVDAGKRGTVEPHHNGNGAKGLDALHAVPLPAASPDGSKS
jgi:hypothetical protein